MNLEQILIPSNVIAPGTLEGVRPMLLLCVSPEVIGRGKQFSAVWTQVLLVRPWVYFSYVFLEL